MQQRQQNDCVVAALARAVGQSYTAVKKVCGSTRGGLELHEIDWLLSRFGE
jgi:hypothetical protein